MSRHRGFEKDVSIHDKISAETGTIGERDSDIVEFKLFLCRLLISPFRRSIAKETETNRNDNYGLGRQETDQRTDILADFRWSLLRNGVQLVCSRLLSLVEMSIVIVENVVEEFVNFLFHF